MIPTSRAWAHVGLRRNFPSNRGKAQSSQPPQPQPLLRCSVRIVHRPHVTKAQATLPDLEKTIPTPTTWLWLEPVARPFRAYGRVQQKRPYMTQFVSALVIYFVGDLVAQGINGGVETRPLPTSAAGDEEQEKEDEDEVGWVQAWAEKRDWHRTGRALIIGGLAAVPGYRWFLWLGNNFNYRSKVLSLATKVLVNQSLFTPLFNTYFFGLHSFLSGASFSETLTRIRNTVPISVLNSCKIWPAVTAFMFAFVPVQYRNIFGGSIAIGWQAYLSLLNQRAAREEGAGEAEAVAQMDREKRVVSLMQRRRGRDEECEVGKCAA